jgi:hypothetical protein
MVEVRRNWRQQGSPDVGKPQASPPGWGSNSLAPPCPGLEFMALLIALLTLTSRVPELSLPTWLSSVVSLTLTRQSNSNVLLCFWSCFLFTLSVLPQVLICFYNQIFPFDYLLFDALALLWPSLSPNQFVL